MSVIKRIIQKVELPPPEGCVTAIDRQLAGEDLMPVPPQKRQWKAISYTNFWIADSFNVNTFAIASSGIVAGLSWWQALIATALGYSMAAPFLCLNGRPGAVHHIKFPTVARASFGIWLSNWIVIQRVCMSIVWWSVQSWIGGQCVAVLLTAIFPQFGRMKNTLPASQNLTVQNFIGFIIFWLLSLPTMWLPIEKARWFFHAKAIIAPIGGFTFLIWSLVKAGGGGEIIHQKAKLTGTAAVWPMLGAIMSCMSNMATLVTNNSDITSYASRPSDAVLPQLITLPLGFTITSLIGIFIASSSGVIYGKVIWDPIENLGMMLDGHPNGATRFGVVVIAACFVYVQLILNLSANSIGAGCDMTALLPRWINIRRGSYVCAFLGIAMNPWQLFKSSNAFTTYLSAYSVLLSSICGIMLCDYYLVRKGNYRVTDLYTNSHKGWYWYSKGCNLRAVVAYLCGIAPNMPGFVAAVSPSTKIPAAATHIYTLSWWVGIIVGGSVYYVLNRIWPEAGAFPERFEEVDLSEYEEYGFANSPKWADGAPTYTYSAHSAENDQESLDKTDMEKLHGVRSEVLDVPELR
ncbi:hypothetical protein QFC22_001379 [Naganishia vaughanmartiniae]|uniref:Uncharacterized protein n=1 Tax=Naganishia vaughanmartiniae TaxID=1424756 RepID=A0ACC2XHS1_9TREE|nr:hypothetical protein QFC22_001379 [Naganishia vaughanmartiniae]